MQWFTQSAALLFDATTRCMPFIDDECTQIQPQMLPNQTDPLSALTLRASSTHILLRCIDTGGLGTPPHSSEGGTHHTHNIGPSTILWRIQ